jgi:predicted ArsR family transcriptional regulator
VETGKIARTPDIPHDVLQFIAEQIDTVPHLEALLLLYTQPAGPWTAVQVARRLYVSPAKATQILRDLEQRTLVRVRPGAAAGEYEYDPTWDETGQLMLNVERAYSGRLVSVATFIHSKAPRSILEFARAFDIKKDR